MINLNFFPSRRLAFYTGKLFLTRGIAVLFSLSLVLMMLNLLSESGKILAVPGNTNADVWHYVALRLPQIVAFAFPFSFSFVWGSAALTADVVHIPAALRG